MFTTNQAFQTRVPATQSLPEPAITLFREVTNRQLEKGNSESISLSVGWKMVKNRFEQVGDKWVARSGAFAETKYFTFKAQKAEEFISRTDDGVELHNYVLSDTGPDFMGTKMDADLLSSWADWINEFKPEADVDHQVWDIALKTLGDKPEEVKKMIRHKKGIAKAMHARVENDQLIVGLAFDNRYKNHIPKIQGLSVEAATVRDALTNTFTSGELLGFTLAMDSPPANPRAVKI